MSEITTQNMLVEVRIRAGELIMERAKAFIQDGEVQAYQEYQEAVNIDPPTIETKEDHIVFGGAYIAGTTFDFDIGGVTYHVNLTEDTPHYHMNGVIGEILDGKFFLETESQDIGNGSFVTVVSAYTNDEDGNFVSTHPFSNVVVTNIAAVDIPDDALAMIRKIKVT